jgi:hypothetical protein
VPGRAPVTAASKLPRGGPAIAVRPEGEVGGASVRGRFRRRLASSRPGKGRPFGLPVGVGSPVGFLPGDIGVSLCATDSLVRFSELAPICAPLLRSTPLASTHRNGYEQNHEDDRDRDDDDDDAGAHLVFLLGCPTETISEKGARDEPAASPLSALGRRARQADRRNVES